MKPGGLYLHIPFCKRKCGYCDFYSQTNLSLREAFTSALLKEIELTAETIDFPEIDTLYFGGGTPTLLPATHLQKIWEVLHKFFRIVPNGEFTIEANPGTVNLPYLKELHQIGFNRLSVGAQSFNPEELKFLERIHTVEDIYAGFRAARQAGFENINLDLMTAFPGLQADKFRFSLQEAVTLQPEHISCYTLIFEPHTPFYRRKQKGELTSPSSDTEAEFYQMADHFLSKSGYAAYEISNYSMEDNFRCRHNLKYWQHYPYLGFGPSAHSFLANTRWRNYRSLHRYREALAENRLPIASREKLDATTLEFEYIFLNLRLKQGINLADFQNRFDTDFSGKYRRKIDRLTHDGLLRQTADCVHLTAKGWLLADEIAQTF